jgi:Sister chromatid cohesion protein Dcc1
MSATAVVCLGRRTRDTCDCASVLGTRKPAEWVRTGTLYDVTRANASPVWEPETTVHTAHPASDKPERCTMDLEALAEKGTVALLTLPHSDLRDRSKALSSSPSSAASTAGVTSLSTAAAAPLAPNAANDDDDNDDRSAPLLLLQLPAGWSPRDLMSSHFVSQGSAGSTVSLVCEARNASFAVHTCETSNVLVLVPPPLPRSASASTGTESAVHKRRKVVTDDGSAGATTSTTSTTLEEVPARLLRTSGASYLELRPQTLSRQALRRALETHHPMVPAEKSGSASASAGRGRSVLELSNHLQVSTFEVRRGLRDVGAFCCAKPDLYVLLSDQTTFECNQLVVSSLGERHIDYSTSYSLHEMTSFVLDRMSDEERFGSMDRVIRFCLLQLSDEAKSYSDDWLEDCALLDHDIRFSLSKVRHLSVRTRPTSRSLRVLFCLTLFS